MAKHCETFDHTADVGLRARGETLAELFEALAEGLARFICPPAGPGAAETKTVRVEAEDVEALLVDFLWQVMTAVQFERLVVDRCRVREIDEGHVAAELCGQRFDPGRHEYANEVKAVTYHQLRVARDGGRWTGQVILDL
jgi:SHS2 domain-containing protein